MKAIAIYHNINDEEIRVEYDDEAPCVCCGEPVIGASMGGTNLCGPCDMGKCRYCGMSTFVMKESVDGGESKRNLLAHMKWHREHDQNPTTAEKNEAQLRLHRQLAHELYGDVSA